MTRLSGQCITNSLIQTFHFNAKAALIIIAALMCTFPLAHAQTYTVLHAFAAGEPSYPQSTLVLDKAGNLYGTSVGLGPGTVFKMGTDGNLTILHTFSYEDGVGVWPGGVTLDDAGNIYGTTAAYPATVFKLDTAGNISILYVFTGGADGGNPSGPLSRTADGTLYGVTGEGGDLTCDPPKGCGVVFKLDPSGHETVLRTFSGLDGQNPAGGLIKDNAGNFYGVTAAGGAYGYGDGYDGYGTIFKLNPRTGVNRIYSFPGNAGAYPRGTLLLDASGNLYGTGGNAQGGGGVVFKLAANGLGTILHQFQAKDGQDPNSGVLQDAAGNLYGTTQAGGRNGCGPFYYCGVVFKLDSITRKETLMHVFLGSGDGDRPNGLVMDSAGNLYGTTQYGRYVVSSGLRMRPYLQDHS